MNGDDGNTGLLRSKLEVTVEVAWVEWIAQPSREDQAAVTPHLARREPSPILLDPMPLNRPQSDRRQWQRGVRGRRLRLTPEQLMPDPLNLPGDERLSPLEVVQLVFNLINQKALPVMESAHKNGYGVIARMPLQFGLLTGKFTEESTFAKDDHRTFRLTKEIISRTNTILEQNAWALCKKYNISKTSLALSFILSFDAVSTVIPGIRTPQHAIDNTKDIIRLEKNDVDHLTALYSSHWIEIVELMEKQK